MALSMPVIEIGMRASWMKRNCSSKIDGSSWSKPTIMPAITSMPACWMRCTESSMSSRRFCVFLRLLQARGARRLDADEDGREVRLAHQLQQLVVLRDVERHLGHELDRIAVRLLPLGERVRAAALASFLLPMKLSSTTKMLRSAEAMDLVAPRPSPASTVLVRGRRPYMTMMSQNSQLNGQPRANWIVIVRYWSIFSRSKRGSGESCMLGFSSWRYSRCQLPGRVVAQELRPGVLGLVDEEDVDLVAQLLGTERGERAAGDDELAAPAELRRDLEDALLVDRRSR